MKKFTQEYVRNKLKEKHFTLLSEYKNNKAKILVRCDICGHEWYVVPSTLLNDIAGCPKCSNKSKVTIDMFIDKINEINLELLTPTGDIQNFNNKTNIKVKCKICGCEFTTTWNKLTHQKSGCPGCINRQVVIGFNDLWTTYPEIASLLKNPDDGYKYVAFSNKIVSFVCPICGNIIEKPIEEACYRGLVCSNCSDGISFPEKFIKNFLLFNNINFIYQKKFNWSQNKKYDFFLPDFNTIIETHGLQHYEHVKKFNKRTLQEEQENDKYKEKLAKENGIDQYLILDCRYSTCDWIRQALKNANIFQLLKISVDDIDWEYIDLKSRKSLIYQICELYNNGHSKIEIMNELKISNGTYCKYLKICADNNMCSYDPEKEKHKAPNMSHIKRQIPVLCETTNKKFESYTKAENYYGLWHGALKRYFRNNSKYCGKLLTGEKLVWKKIS